MIINLFLYALAAYLMAGLVFAVPFIFVGVARIDSHAQQGSWGFRLLILPGAMAFWPLLARRWMRHTVNPPEEQNAHRAAAETTRP